jgi:hypothetical protein
MTDHDHDHADHEHHHHPQDWEGELLAMRQEAGHYYEHQFDWRGHEPPPGYAGPRWFPPAAEWRLAARLDEETAAAGQHMQIATSTGQLRDMEVAGDLVFEAEGGEHRLTAFHSHAPDGSHVLFVPFRDATSGQETYGAGRYVEVPYDQDADVLELDFNYAYNPSCVFSPAYDCPFPPPQNRLSVPVRAGEMLPYDADH